MNLESINMLRGKQTSGNIPIRFVDEESASNGEREQGDDDNGRGSGDQGELTPEELGRASSYEDATEMQRRIDRGSEEEGGRGRGEADEKDTAGVSHPSDLPENRRDRDTTLPDPEFQTDSPYSGSSDGHGDPASAYGLDVSAPDISASGPALAELLATRAELRRVGSEMQKSETERMDLRDQLARRQAEFDNYRKRIERERSETYNQIVGDVVNKLLPVIDNLRRALDAETAFKAQESNEFRHFLDGVELTYKQLNDVLIKYGVEAVPTVGEPFDPHIHEAIATEASSDYEPDTVIAEIVRGYRLGEKLLRPAMVKVAIR
ncbi:MAG: nucleotide exchange factor GrpE [Pyrinomonadaceae bacterium]|nr:nucleotide exchange factor GrpE [Pyrinomonadaceae bacterium]